MSLQPVFDIANFFVEIMMVIGYPGAFLAGFLGAQYFPSWFVIPFLGRTLEPLFVGILAGVGAGFGQFLHYYIGVGGRWLAPRSKTERLDVWKRRLERHGALLIFIFAVSPLTVDDLVWIPIGIIGYSKIKALGAVIIGKVLLNLAYAYTGALGLPVLEEMIQGFV